MKIKVVSPIGDKWLTEEIENGVPIPLLTHLERNAVDTDNPQELIERFREGLRHCPYYLYSLEFFVENT